MADNKSIKNACLKQVYKEYMRNKPKHTEVDIDVDLSKGSKEEKADEE